MVNKELGNTNLCIGGYAWRGLDTSLQDGLSKESVLIAFQRHKSGDEFYTSYCVLLVRSMQVGKVPEEGG